MTKEKAMSCARCGADSDICDCENVSESSLTGLLSVGFLVSANVCGPFFYEKHSDADWKRRMLHGCTGVVMTEVFKRK